MNTLKFWKKLNSIVKSGTPMDAAKSMVESGEITKDEITWAITALATLPIVMLETMQQKGMA